MTTIATLGPQGSHAEAAARHYDAKAEIHLFPSVALVKAAFESRESELAVIPVYNTREGELREYFRAIDDLRFGTWIDNVVLPVSLSLGALEEHLPLRFLVGKGQILRQCEEYITSHYPEAALITTGDLEGFIADIKAGQRLDHGVIEAEAALLGHGFFIREREVAPHNRTRYAVLGPSMPPASGYDATSVITAPLMDRVGLLFDILGEFSRRGISLQDLRTTSDVKTQKLRFYMEVEGHSEDQKIKAALERIEQHIIGEPGTFKVLGSYPRVDIRTKLIGHCGFIGTGEMSQWFASRLESEGYRTALTGRNTELRPEEMIATVDVVFICVPISSTVATIEQYGPLLKDGQALILLAGEAETTLAAAMAHTRPGVELMLLHNLWGPQASTMKNKNAAVVRTPRSGALCSEFEAFLYKHGADIQHDTPGLHDQLMGVGQKLPTSISVALAKTLADNNIPTAVISSHSTLTSLYGILAMARIHRQSPRTYAEIMATKGAGRKIVQDFVANLAAIMDLSESGDIAGLCALMDGNRQYLSDQFLENCMAQSLAMDETLGRLIKS
jgi:prephenate dehydratase/prephenate dehydrogenase